MENYKNLVLQNEIGNAQTIRPISKDGISIIDTYPLDVIERLGKYQFIYDYSANSSTSSYNMNNWVNFSKGDVVEVVRFQLGSAIINNPNYKDYSLTSSPAPDTSVKPKWDWSQIVTGFGNKKELEIPKEYLQKVDDSTSVTIPTGVNFGANPKPQPIYVMPPVKPVEVKPYVEPKPYLVVQDFIIYSRWENRMGQSGVQELPYQKGGVIFLPTTPHQDQFDIALKGGKLQELPIVSVMSLVDKQMGKCVSNGALIQTTEYNPCRTVQKGEILTGYVANGVFSNTTKGLMKPQLSFGEYKLVQTNSGSGVQANSGVVVPAKNDNKNLLMIVGAFLVGYVVFSKGKSE
jgi:hypothetical protein